MSGPVVPPATETQPPAAPAVPPPPAGAPGGSGAPPTVPAAGPITPPEFAGWDATRFETEVRRLRQENAGDRVTVKQRAADEARTALIQEMGVKLGIIKAGDTATPEQLTQQLTDAQAAQRVAAVELAVFRAAGPLGADPVALLDSRGFLAKIDKLDPTDGGKIRDTIEKWCTDNPKFKAAVPGGQGHGRTGADFAGGTGGPPTDIDAQIAQALKDGKPELSIALKRQKAYGWASGSPG